MKNWICENYAEVRAVMLYRHGLHSIETVDGEIFNAMGVTHEQVEEMLAAFESGVKMVTTEGGDRLMRMFGVNSVQLRHRQFVVGTEKERESVEYPETWWDAFKLRWLPRRLLGKWPVRMRTVSMERYCIYPEVRAPSGRSAIGIPVMGRRDGSYTNDGGERD